MAFQIAPMPDFNVKIPPPFDPLAQQQKQATLSGMLDENALRKQLAPLQVQEQQQKVAQETTTNQLTQMKLASMQARVKAWSDPDFVDCFMGSSNSGLES